MKKQIYSFKSFIISLFVSIGIGKAVNGQQCSVVYQATPNIAGGGNLTYRYIRTLNTANGTGGTIIYNGATGPCYSALTGTTLANGSILTNTAALAYAPNTNRIYFVNNSTTAEDLCYIDLNTSPVRAIRYVGYPLETNTGAGYNINRMTIAADGYGYALTSNARDLIRFSIDSSTNLPPISRLGQLVNDPSNGAYDILSEVGGDIFGDASAKLYLIVNSGRLYKIDPATRITTYLGAINPVSGNAFTSVATDIAGNVYLGGAYQNVYKVDLTTMSVTTINSSATNVWYNSDYTSCALPALAPELKADKSYLNKTGSTTIGSGDTVEYTIEVSNTGNINGAGIRLYDSIPAEASYLNGSTTLNGIPVLDVNYSMPFSVTGGRLINSPGELAGIVKPGSANKAVIKFLIGTYPGTTICNQSTVIFPDGSDTLLIKSDDPTQPGTQDSTCFWVDSVIINDRLAYQPPTQSSLNKASNIHSYQVKPNPFVNELNVQVQLNTPQTVGVRLIDLYGRTVFTTREKLGAGANSLRFSVPAGLAHGVYVLELSAGNNSLLQKKLIKQ